jgi:hypothetical protein
MDDEAKKIEGNWNRFRQLCNRLGDRTDGVNKMLDHFEQRAALTPASSRTEYHNSHPGGLIDHSLRVLSNLNKLVKAYGFEDKISKESMIIAGLFHDWGKIGSVDEDLYLDQQSDWHRDRGMMYTHNRSMQYMTTSHRALFLFQHFGVYLTEDEFLSILLNDGMYIDDNKPYRMKEPTLAVLVHHADRMACQQEKGS